MEELKYIQYVFYWGLLIVAIAIIIIVWQLVQESKNIHTKVTKLMALGFLLLVIGIIAIFIATIVVVFVVDFPDIGFQTILRSTGVKISTPPYVYVLIGVIIALLIGAAFSLWVSAKHNGSESDDGQAQSDYWYRLAVVLMVLAILCVLPVVGFHIKLYNSLYNPTQFQEIVALLRTDPGEISFSGLNFQEECDPETQNCASISLREICGPLLFAVLVWVVFTWSGWHSKFPGIPKPIIDPLRKE